MFISRGGFLTYAMYHHRKTIKPNYYSLKNQRKGLLQTTRANDPPHPPPSSVTVGLGKDKHQALTYR